MSPLDSSIPLQTRAPEMRSPLGTLGALAQLRGYQDMQEQRELMNEQRRRALDDDNAIRTSLQRFERPDDAVMDLYKQGRASAAGALGEQLVDWRTKQATQLKLQSEATEQRLKLSAQILQNVKDENSFQSARRAVAAMWGPDMGPKVAAELGETYQPDRVKQLVSWGTTRAESLKAEQDGIENFFKAWGMVRDGLKTGADMAEATRKADEFYHVGTSRLLSTARTEEEWDQKSKLALQGGASPQVLARFGTWAPDAPKRALQLGQTPDQRADSAHQAATLAETTRHHKVMETDAAGGGGGGITANRRSEVATWKANKYREIEDELRTNYSGANGVVKIPDEIAPQIGQRKLAIEDQSREMLGLPPLLVAEFQARSDPKRTPDLTKLRSTYRSLTGGATPLEEMEQLAAEMKKAKDPKKQTELRTRYNALRERYRGLVGR